MKIVKLMFTLCCYGDVNVYVMKMAKLPSPMLASVTMCNDKISKWNSKINGIRWFGISYISIGMIKFYNNDCGSSSNWYFPVTFAYLVYRWVYCFTSNAFRWHLLVFCVVTRECFNVLITILVCMSTAYCWTNAHCSKPPPQTGTFTRWCCLCSFVRRLVCSQQERALVRRRWNSALILSTCMQ